MRRSSMTTTVLAVALMSAACGGGTTEPTAAPSATVTVTETATPSSTPTSVPTVGGPSQVVEPLPEPIPGTPPLRAVIAWDDGRLEIVATNRNNDPPPVIGTIATFDDPTVDEEIGAYLSAIAVGDDGRLVFVDVCCEPAVGHVQVRDLSDGGEEFGIGLFGLAPAVGGDLVARVEFASVVVAAIDGSGEERRYAFDDEIDSFEAGGLGRPAISPDGTLMAVPWFPPGGEQARMLIVDLGSSSTDLDNAGVLSSGDDSVGWIAPAFRADGKLIVSEQDTLIFEEAGATPATGVLVQPGEGIREAEFTLDGHVVGQQYDRTHTWLLTTYSDGHVGWQGQGRRGNIALSGALDAAW